MEVVGGGGVGGAMGRVVWKSKTPNPTNQSKKTTIGERRGGFILVLHVSRWVKAFWWIVFLVGCQSHRVFFHQRFSPGRKGWLSPFIWYLQEFGAREQIAASTHGLWMVCGLHGLDLLSLCRFGVICRAALLMRVVTYRKFWTKICNPLH